MMSDENSFLPRTPRINSRRCLVTPEEGTTRYSLINTIECDRVMRFRSTEVGAPTGLSVVTEGTRIHDDRLATDTHREAQSVRVCVCGEGPEAQWTGIGNEEDLVV